jgi:hypothetical protein
MAWRTGVICPGTQFLYKSNDTHPHGFCLSKTGLKNLSCFIAALFLCCTNPLTAFADDGWDHSIAGIPAFADAQSQLQVLVNIRGFQQVNQFCVVAAHDHSAAEVYWSTENKLILWEPMNIPFALLWSRDYVDLRHDVVANADDITPQNMVLPWTRPAANEVISNCLKYGTKFTVIKSENGWVRVNEFSQFSSIKLQLQTLVDTQGRSRSNDFCVIGQKDGNYLAAYVYWATENRMIIWNPDPNDFSEPHGLANSYSSVDLKTGAVDREFYSRTITEMPRSYADKILRACRASGQKFSITKSN